MIDGKVQFLYFICLGFWDFYTHIRYRIKFTARNTRKSYRIKPQSTCDLYSQDNITTIPTRRYAYQGITFRSISDNLLSKNEVCTIIIGNRANKR